MYKECLMTQSLALGMVMQKRPDIEIPKQQRYLYVAVMDKAIDALLLWEFAASRDPYAVLLATRNQREKIAEYIEKYVYVSDLSQ